MKEAFYEIDCKRILELMAMIEGKTGKLFHESFPDLDESCRAALDGETHASFVINQLCKLVDSMEEAGK